MQYWSTITVCTYKDKSLHDNLRRHLTKYPMPFPAYTWARLNQALPMYLSTISAVLAGARLRSRWRKVVVARLFTRLLLLWHKAAGGCCRRLDPIASDIGGICRFIDLSPSSGRIVVVAGSRLVQRTLDG
jgi:hypothetical protein